MYSIRKRLNLVLAVGFTALIVGADLYVANTVDAQLTGEFDAALVVKARALAALTDQEAGQIEFDYTPGSMPEFARDEQPDYFQFWLDDGTSLLRSDRLTVDLPRGDTTTDALAIRDVTLPDGRAGRLVTFAFLPSSDPDPDEAPSPPSNAPQRGLILGLARGRDDLDGILANVRWAILGVGGLAIGLAALLIWRALALGFRPIDKIARQVANLDAENLNAHVKLQRTPRELAPIVDQLNALLARLAKAFERERRFTGNVAHELRTPLAELRSLATVGAKWPDDAAAIQQFFGDVHAVAGRMERVITDLLLLARCQAGVERVSVQAVDLGSAVRAAWSGCASATATGQLDLALEVADPLTLETDPGKLGLILTNLTNNAITYAPPGSRVQCTATNQGTRFTLEIANQAQPLSPAELSRLTEPFWRGDEARSSEEHAGLGLALVHALCEALGLDLSFSQGADGIFRVRLAGALSTAPAPANPKANPSLAQHPVLPEAKR